jgi:hypothetical protein
MLQKILRLFAYIFEVLSPHNLTSYYVHVNLNTQHELKKIPGSLSSLFALPASAFQNLSGSCRNIIKNDEEQKSKDYVLTRKAKGL